MLNIINEIPASIEAFLRNLDNEELVPHEFEKVNHETSHGDIYRIYDNYCLKIFNPKKICYGKCEIDVLLKLQNKDYAPKLYAYSSSKYMLTEWIDGYSLSEYVSKYNKVPNNFVDSIYDMEIDMIKCGISYVDTKYNEHIIWLATDINKFKLIDYGVCDLFDKQDIINYLIKSKNTEHEKIKNKDNDALHDLKQNLFIYGIPSERIEEYILSL